jgi:hypothetical protein
MILRELFADNVHCLERPKLLSSIAIDPVVEGRSRSDVTDGESACGNVAFRRSDFRGPVAFTKICF